MYLLKPEEWRFQVGYPPTSQQIDKVVYQFLKRIFVETENKQSEDLDSERLEEIITAVGITCVK